MERLKLDVIFIGSSVTLTLFNFKKDSNKFNKRISEDKTTCKF